MVDAHKNEILKEVSRYLYKKNFLIGLIEKTKHLFAARLSGNTNYFLLDLGCGFGEHFKYAGVKNRSIGIDINLDLLRSTIRDYPYVSLIQSDAARIPLRDHCVDCIVTLSVLEHISNIDACLFEMKRILKHRGKLIVGLPSDGLLFNIGRAITVKKYITKKFHIDYEKLCSSEHVNELDSVVKKLRNSFTLCRARGVPFVFASKHLNAFLLYEFKS